MGALNQNYDVRYGDVPTELILPWWRIENHPSYIDDWDKQHDNYFARLLESIKNDGIKVPMILLKGGGHHSDIMVALATHCDNNSIQFPFKHIKSLYHYNRLDKWFISVNRGCARIHVANQLKLKTMPSIILDFNGSCGNLEEITTEEQFLSKFDEHFRSKIKDIKFGPYDIKYFIHQDDEMNF